MDQDRKQYIKDFKKRLYQFTLKLIALLDSLPVDMVLRRIGVQLLRSGNRVMGNYVRGHEGRSNKDFANDLPMALKSAK